MMELMRAVEDARIGNDTVVRVRMDRENTTNNNLTLNRNDSGRTNIVRRSKKRTTTFPPVDIFSLFAKTANSNEFDERSQRNEKQLPLKV